MAAINWNESLSVKIASIDEQHKKLISMINSFYDNINEKSSKELMFDLIKALKEYTVFHFSIEEKYMKQYEYPGYASHKKEHDKFFEKVLSFEERYKNGKLILTVEITNFIKDWVSDHIMNIDKKYSDYLIKKGVK